MLFTASCTKNCNKFIVLPLPEVESSRTSLASRTHFEVLGFGLEGQVLGLGLEVSRPQVLENWPVLGSRTALFFELLKFRERLKNFLEKVILWRSLEKFLWRPFFSCVLGPCPWPRAFLSLASRVSVLGKAVLGLGFGFFLFPWPWPRAVCLRLHLWPLQ